MQALYAINDIEDIIGNNYIKKTGKIDEDLAKRLLYIIVLFKKESLKRDFPDSPSDMNDYKSPYLRIDGKYVSFLGNGFTEVD